MDPWLQDEIKELLAKPCLLSASMVAARLENRIKTGQEIDERALTELLVDAFDTESDLNAWKPVLQALHKRQIYVNTTVRKSTTEYRTGADIGLVIQRNFYSSDARSEALYAALIQCKRVDRDGRVQDFFHVVKSTKQPQSKLLLDITPASFYFLFVPPSLVKTYCTREPLAFIRAGVGCSSPIWNMGCFAVEGEVAPFLTADQKAGATGVLVVPALAVSAQQQKGALATLDELLPNALPFWYWFSELFVPGFVGDYRKEVIAVAQNKPAPRIAAEGEVGVRHSVQLSVSNG